MDVMQCGSDFIAEVKRRFLERGLECAVGIVEAPTPEPELTHTICPWVVDYTPQDFGFFELGGRARFCPRFYSKISKLPDVVKRSEDGCISLALYGEMDGSRLSSRG
jgi:hypothetical protein